MNELTRLQQLPPYVFTVIDELKAQATARGDAFIDLGMGNPDLPPPAHVIDTLVAATREAGSHRYSVSQGITPLREAICQWYAERYAVELNPDTEAVVTIGAKEGLAHLPLMLVGAGDKVLVPEPNYPIHTYGFVIAGADIGHYSCMPGEDILANITTEIENTWPKPKVLVLNFPSNPTTACADLAFYEAVIALAKKHQIWVIQDFAYADITFDGYRAPSILQVPGAKDIAVETVSLSKNYSMPGCRVGFMCGNPELVAALKRLKSYLDYGVYEPIQKAAVAALTGPQDGVEEIRSRYQQRRDDLCAALNNIGWSVDMPKATMFVWAKIPEQYRDMGSLAFTKHVLDNAHVALSPGIGFGPSGDGHVRFSLLEDKPVMDKMAENLKAMFDRDLAQGRLVG